MNFSSGLLCILSCSYGPSSHLVFSDSIEMTKLQLFICRINYLFDFALFAFFQVLFMLNRIFYDLGLKFSVLGY